VLTKKLCYAWILSIMFLFAAAGSGDSATNVSGLISSNTTWTATNSPYTVTGNVLINSGITLTIEPGVTVKFDSLRSLQINGQLIARGTEGNKITFTSSAAIPAAGDWGYLFFNDSSTDASFDAEGLYAGGSILEHAIVEYAGGATSSYGAVEMTNAHPFINDCTIRNNSKSGIYAGSLSAALKITNSDIHHNTRDCLDDDGGGGVFTSGGTATIANNLIHDNSTTYHGDGGGIYIRTGTAIITGNTILNNTAVKNGGAVYIHNGTATLTNNTIRGNTASWELGGVYTLFGTSTISGNIISKNDGGILIYYGGATITNNIISGNTAPYTGGGIYIKGAAATITNNIISDNAVRYDLSYDRNAGGIALGDSRSGSVVTITKNAIIRNSAKNASALDYPINDYGSSYDGVNIAYNTITGNAATNATPTHTTLISYLPLFNDNNIFNNTGTFELFNSNGNASAALNAKNNWWGTSVDEQVQARIYDWFDDASRGFVEYAPFATAMNTDAPLSPPTGLTAIAGTGQMTLSWAANPEPDLAGYRIHWGSSSGFPYGQSMDVGNVTSYTVTGLPAGTTYATVTAYDATAASVSDDPNTLVNEKQTAGNESWYAKEVVVQSFPLTVTKSGSASGTITSIPAGIHCGDDCTEFYSAGSSVHLTAVPEAGSIFTGWSGGGCSGIGACTVLMDAARGVNASFIASATEIIPMFTFNPRNNYAYDAATGIIHTVSQNGLATPPPDINPAQTLIVFAEDAAIKVFNIASKTTTTLPITGNSKNNGGGPGPFFNSEGKIVFVDNTGTLKKADPNGSNVVTVASPTSFSRFSYYVVSPDRTQLAVIENRWPSSCTNYTTCNYETLVLMNTDGTGRRVLKSEYLGEWNLLSWRHDSRAVFYYHHHFSGGVEGPARYTLLDFSIETIVSTDFSGASWDREENACFFTKKGNLLGMVYRELYDGKTGSLIADVSATVPNMMTSGMVGFGRDGEIYFANGDKSNFRKFNESAYVMAPIIHASETAHNFGSVTAGGNSAPWTLTVSNQGNASLAVGAISLAGANASEFNKSGDTCSQQNLLPSMTCTITLSFKPTGSGAKSTVLTIPSSDPDAANLFIPLSGTGTPAPVLTVAKTGRGAGVIISGPAGIHCGADCTETYSEVRTVMMAATAFYGSVFSGWAGDCTGSAPTASVVMNTDRSCMARFDFTAPVETADGGNVSLNSAASGSPDPLESDAGWGGGTRPWDLVDGKRMYAGEWARGLAFTGGTASYGGQSCGWRQATINFGAPRTFNRVAVWHHGLDQVPNTYKIQTWNGATWVDAFSTTNGHDYLKFPVSSPVEWWESWSTPTENTFDPVTSSKVRFTFNNCDITHGWLYEIEVYYDTHDGDMNYDKVIDLADAILAIKALAGLNPPGINAGVDINGDGKIGAAEVIYILQKVAGVR
jgi:parallel beta-helix repeat protein